MSVIIYDLDCNMICGGLQSTTICNEAMLIAKQIAKEKNKSVILEDTIANKTWRVTPSGNQWKPPKWWSQLTLFVIE